jgi:hypothetical protein
VLNEALRQQHSWREDGVDLTIAVNISAHSLRPSSNLPEIVAELTETWRTAPHSLTLELTEGALTEADAPEIMSRLHEMGHRLSIDDFGAGYSSLGYLQRLPVVAVRYPRDCDTLTGSRCGSEVCSGVLEPVIAPEQLVVDRDRRHADHAGRVRRVGRVVQRLLDLRVARRRRQLMCVDSDLPAGFSDVGEDAQLCSTLEGVAIRLQRELASQAHGEGERRRAHRAQVVGRPRVGPSHRR